MKKIGILGSGIVGKTLAQGFSDLGYDVMIATRSAEKLAEWKNEVSDNIKIGSFLETSSFSDLLLLAVKGTVAKEVVADLGNDLLGGKVIMDASNPIENAPPENGVLRFFTSINRSLMEDLQDTAPDAHFIKAFSCIGSAHMVNPKFESKPTMFIAGNNHNAKDRVSKLIEAFGFDVEDMGTAESARAIEPLCMLWCIPGFQSNSWNHAFKLLKS